MGIDVFVLDFLASQARAAAQPFGATLTLGRQGFHVPAEGLAAAEKVVAKYFPDASVSDFYDGSSFSERLFRFLGSTSIKAMDISAFEGAEVVHDLNSPIPPELKGQFDCVFDGGTIEHVYDVPQAFRNVAALLKLNGLFLLVDAANNQLGHGLYQFSPELLTSAFSASQGFRVECLQLMELVAPPTARVAIDPRRVGKRVEIGRTANPTYIMMAARKVSENVGSGVYQSDYESRWGRH